MSKDKIPTRSFPLFYNLAPLDESSSDNDCGDWREPAVKRQRISLEPRLDQCQGVENQSEPSLMPPIQQESTLEFNPGDYYFSSSDSEVNSIQKANNTQNNKGSFCFTNWPKFPIIVPSTSGSDGSDSLPGPANSNPKATTSNNLNVPYNQNRATNDLKNPARIQRPPPHRYQIPTDVSNNFDNEKSSGSSSDSFSCILESVFDNKTGIGLVRNTNRGRKIVMDSSLIDSRFPVPLELDIRTAQQKFNNSPDSSTISSFPSPQTGDEIVLPADWDHDSDNSERSERDCISPKQVDDDRVYDLEFEPASVSESEINKNPIEDASSSSGVDEQAEVIPSFPDGDSRGCRDDATFADEESDFTDKSDPHGISSDSELSEKDKWPCHQCKSLTHAVSRYCLRCFRTRRNWLPNRPKPRARTRDTAECRNDGKLPERDYKRSYTSYSDSTSASDEDQDEIGSSKLKRQSKRSGASSSHVVHKEDDSTRPGPTLQSLPVLNAVAEGNNLSQPQLSQQSASSTSSSRSQTIPSSSIQGSFPKLAPTFPDDTRQIYSSQEPLSSNSERSSQFSQSSDTSLPLSQPQQFSPALNDFPCLSTATRSTSTVSVTSTISNGIAISSSTASSKQLTQSLLSVAETPLKIEQIVNNSHRNSVGYPEMCSMCCIREKDAAFVHNKIAHRCCCYNCAVKILKRTGRCPICRGKILRVVRIIND